MRVLSRHRAATGASDLQAHVPAVAAELAGVGLRLALASGRPERLLMAIERWRGQDLRARPVRPPREPALSEAVERLRRVSSERLQARVSGGEVAAMSTAQAAAEREVVRLSRRAPAGPWQAPPRPAGVAELRAGLGSRVLVEYLVLDRELIALSLAGAAAGDGRLRLHRLGAPDDVEEALAHLQFALGRLATGRGSAAALRAAMTSAESSTELLDRRLVRPLAAELGRYAPGTPPAVVVAPTEALHAVPWSLLPTLSRAPVHLVRSGTAWLAAQGHAAVRQQDPRARRDVVVSGPDVSAAPSLPDSSAALSGDAATVGAVLRELDGAWLAHVAAHGGFRSDNPLLSSLRLADGDLTVYDLESLTVPPRLVLLAACHSAVAQVLPGNQLLGVAHSLLTLGSAGVVATTLPTPDAETDALMRALHRHLADGAEPAEALWRARRVLDTSDPAGFATVAGFDLYGC
jgi:hypothetical protein